MTATATRQRTLADVPTEDVLRHYTPEELVDQEGPIRLPTTARMLREWAYKRRIPHRKVGGRITFTAADVLAISDLFAVPVVATASKGRGSRAA